MKKFLNELFEVVDISSWNSDFLFMIPVLITVGNPQVFIKKCRSKEWIYKNKYNLY